MGFFDYVADLYSAVSVTQVEAEEPSYQGVPDKSGEQSDAKDARSGGVGTAQHDRGATTRGGVSTASPASGTDEESDSEKEVNAEDSGSSDDGDEEASSGRGAVPDTDDGEEEEEEDEDEDEPKDPKPRLEEECMKSSQCSGVKHHYDECAERVQKQIDDSGKPEEDCVEEYFHLMHCATQCASAKLFRSLR